MFCTLLAQRHGVRRVYVSIPAQATYQFRFFLLLSIMTTQGVLQIL
jgi:hypothetical protein